MSLDFSRTTELTALARVASALQPVAATAGADFFLMGAAARDLMLRHAYGIRTTRQTEDVDFAVMMADWDRFVRLRAALISSGEFIERPGPATHRMRHRQTGLPLDIVPFGGIERADRTIAWPPDHAEIFDCFGVREALAVSVWVELPERARLRVASIPALALLKITAWQDRKHTLPGRDAVDLLLYMRTYMDCDNIDRAAIEHADLFESGDYDHERAGAQLLGRDIARLVDRPGTERVLRTLLPEADERGALLLAHQSALDLERARRLISSLCDGLADGVS